MSDPAEWGIEPGYHDVAGIWHDAPPETVAAFLRAMGAAGAQDAGAQRPAEPGDGPVFVVRAGETVGVDGDYVLTLEDGTVFEGHGMIPSEVPLGYHEIDLADRSRRIRLIVSPRRAWLPEGMRTWGWATQLYATRSHESWGIGDLSDLARLAAWSNGVGAGMVLVNPLHASLPGLPQQPSPYYPSSRCFRNPIYLRVEDVPGAETLGPELEAAAAAGRALNRERLIDRDAVWILKLAALEAVFTSTSVGAVGAAADPAFDAYCATQGRALLGYATFCALTETYGRGWATWPADVRHPERAGVAAFAADPINAGRIRFHQWLQYLLDRQLAGAAASAPGLALVHDLAIGADPSGADAWWWQDAYALDVRVGAPPDEFNQAGQDWGFPPLDPWRLRAAAFEPFIRIVRAGLRHAGGLRIDHVMGLFRLFWIPEGQGPGQGTYVRYPWSELLDILALESVRAGAYVVGEDLGTVEPWVRDELARRRILSYRLMWFEEGRPEEYPAQALSAISTHDLPTVVGLWTGSDVEDQRAAGVEPNVTSTTAIRSRLAGSAGLAEDVHWLEVVAGAHRLLGRAPSVIVTATLDDALGVAERPNLPGTVDEHPNWCLALPIPLDALEDDPGVAAVAAILRDR